MKTNRLHSYISIVATILFIFGINSAVLNSEGLCSDGGFLEIDEVLTSKYLDIDADGDLDLVLIAKTATDIEIRIYEQLDEKCNLIVNEYFTYFLLIDAEQKITDSDIQQIELTGVPPYELYFTVSKRGPSVRSSSAVNYAIYSDDTGNWTRIFVFNQCYNSSVFEFRPSETKGKALIYIVDDPRCGQPFSSQNNYAVLEWQADANRFITIEEGTTEDQYYSPLELFCDGILVFFIVMFLALLAWFRRKWVQKQA